MKGILKESARRFGVLLLAVVMVLSLLPVIEMPASAATSLNTGIDGLTASYDGGTWSAANGVLTGSATGTGGCNSATAKTTLTLTNSKSNTVQLTLKYIGFTTEPLFVVGWGLDCNDRFRTLGDIMVYHNENLHI